jgi:regulator of replication initiation timing
MNTEVNAQKVINNLLEQNKQLTFEVAVLRAQLEQDDADAVDEQPTSE